MTRTISAPHGIRWLVLITTDDERPPPRLPPGALIYRLGPASATDPATLALLADGEEAASARDALSAPLDELK